MARNVRPGPNWIPATIVEVQGPVTYLVETDDRQVWKRHLDQLKEFHERRETTDLTSENTEFPCIPHQEHTEPEELVEPNNVELDSNTENNIPDSLVETQASTTVTPRYPSRNRQPPDRFM